MAKPLRTVVEQDVGLHTLGHIFTKLRGQRPSRTTFVIVEGSDDLAFFKRFFDNRSVSAYYSTKKTRKGEVITGGCDELMNIVRTVLDDGRTDRVIGIMDTDYRKYIKGYTYPRNIFNTDCRDMEMMALSMPSVRQKLAGWIPDFNSLESKVEPVLRHVGLLRILNDKFRLGCNFDKCKIDRTHDERSHDIFKDWRKRYDKAFLKSILLNKRKDLHGKVRSFLGLCKACLHCMVHSYKTESSSDLLQGHDTIHLLSLCTERNSVYSEDAIWEKCFDSYTPVDFAGTKLFAAINVWQAEKGLSLFKQAVV